MKHPKVSEKEFEVIRQIAGNHQANATAVNQREIAQRTGMSVGMTNLIIKRLVTKGYVKLKQLTPKKIQYLLTPKGFAEKAKKSYRFTLKTINLLGQMKSQIRQLIEEEYQKGVRRFIIIGQGELAGLVKVSSQGLNLSDVSYDTEISDNKIDVSKTLILITDENADGNLTNGYRTVNIINLLAEHL
ncbi:MAG: winged helix-turn-helix transcriptional regulator [Planctomycetes bacterium]|nr:winged helix-turn-helix transcriptional regulator [Planctomycetota bacterium]